MWNWRQSEVAIMVATAKGEQVLAMTGSFAPAVDALEARDIASRDPVLKGPIAAGDLEFVDAEPMVSSPVHTWESANCAGDSCVHVTFYDHRVGGTAEAIVDVHRAIVVDAWRRAEARPAGSVHVLARAIDIAAADPAVREVVGSIGDVDPAMVPMSAWLNDDPCRDEWCVDLTFHDPLGSGRIFHVFVNMQRDTVARTFFTRGRPPRVAAKPIAQRNAFTDGCHEEYGWEVCWQMTPADGLDVQDATYDNQLVFSSARIGQVEAWYPSWPGGYRDEIGYSATVPPFGDTVINDLGDGFEIRQLFTEFTQWPNCICCYRYEEIVRFYEDGRLDFQFVSYGPGCDDLSIYRPFWRIDLDLDGPEGDSVWLWGENAWNEAEKEFEDHPLVDDLSPDGRRLATFDGDLHYRWFMEETDPLGLDEGYLFLLRNNEHEGEGPITPGPGDTYNPPRQWVDGEALSGENVVLWHVPLLKTKKGGPWWCMPDPEPSFSPCSSTLHAVPAGELTQPTAEEIEELLEKPDLPTATPLPTQPLPPTPRPVEGSTPEEIILNSGCGSCHQIGELGEGHKVGPDLSAIGILAEHRVASLSGEDYLRQSILDPNAQIAPQCPNGPCMGNIMPRDYQSRLSAEQLELLIGFLLEQTGGNSSMSIETPEATRKASPAAKSIAPHPVKSTSQVPATVAVQILILSLVFLVSLLIYWSGDAE